jgi:hypothetical protein
MIPSNELELGRPIHSKGHPTLHQTDREGRPTHPKDVPPGSGAENERDVPWYCLMWDTWDVP